MLHEQAVVWAFPPALRVVRASVCGSLQMHDDIYSGSLSEVRSDVFSL